MRAPRDRLAGAAVLLLAVVACWRAALGALAPPISPPSSSAEPQRMVAPPVRAIAETETGGAPRALRVRRLTISPGQGGTAALLRSYGYLDRQVLLTLDAEGHVLLVQPSSSPSH